MKLRSSRGRSQDREGVGMPFRMTAAPEDSNQIAEIHTAPETASFTPGNSLERESIRHKRLAELWKRESIDGHVFPLGLLLERRERRLASNVYRLSDEE